MPKEDRTKAKAIIIDEAWKLIGAKQANNTKAAQFVLDIFKLIRGYGGSAIAATQDINDFFALEDGKYGKGIINNCETKLFLKTKPDEVRAIREKVGQLSDNELERISKMERGNALFSSGGNNVFIEIITSAVEMALITTDREELEMLRKMGGIEAILKAEGLAS